MPQVLWKGNPTDTTGPELKAGDKAPDAFSVAGNDLSAVKGSDWAGKTRIVPTSPSLDTPVCDIEGRRFNDEAVRFAQTRTPNGMDQPIATLPTIQARVANMQLDLMQARTLLYATAELKLGLRKMAKSING